MVQIAVTMATPFHGSMQWIGFDKLKKREPYEAGFYKPAFFLLLTNQSIIPSLLRLCHNYPFALRLAQDERLSN